MATINDTSLLFDGIDDYISIPHSSSLSLTNFTIETWVNPSQIKGDWQPLITKEENDSWPRNYGMYITPNAMTVAFSFTDTNGVNRYSSSQSSLILNQWNHIAMTYDRSSLKFYLNGNLDASIATTAIPLQNTEPIKIGKEISAYTPFFGKIDEVRIWNVVRTAEEIQANYTQELTGNETGLVGYWQLNEASGTSVTDLSSNNNNNGTILGGAAFTSGVFSPGTFVFSQPNFSVTESGHPLTEVTINRIDGLGGDASVTVNLSDGSATSPDDYDNTPIVVNFANGETSKTVKLERVSQGVLFDGINDYISVPHSSSLQPQQFTLEANVKPTGNGSDNDQYGNMIFAKGGAYTSGNFLAHYGLCYSPVQEKFWVFISYLQPSVGQYVFSSKTYPKNQNYAVSVTYDGNTIKLYVNGELDIESSATNPSINYGSDTSPLFIGSGNYGDPNSPIFKRRFQGVIDEVRIWDKAQTQSEIQGNLNHELTGNESGLIGYWNLNSINGNTVEDLSNNNNNGTIIGEAQPTIGIVPTSLIINDAVAESPENLTLTLSNPTNGATLGSQNTATLTIFENAGLSFDGVNDYVQINLNEPETEVTHELWFKTTNPNVGLFSVMDASNSHHDRHIYLSQGNLYTRLYNHEVLGSTGLNLADGNWHHVAHTFGASIGGEKLYIDGQLVASGTKAQSDFTWQNRVLIGYSIDAPADFFQGQIDEVRIWNKTRTQAEIQADMNRQLTGMETGLLAYFPFDEGINGTVIDRSGNNNNGIISGATWTEGFLRNGGTGASNHVSEISNYRQIYQLAIPNDSAFGAIGKPNYQIDNSGTKYPISRIGYYLELDYGTGTQWVWVSMDAFTQDFTKIGVPTWESGAFWQQTINNMNVESNVSSIVKGQGITTGNIEFWPHNYYTWNVANISGANPNNYDFGDQIVVQPPQGTYASMQVHNYGAGQTLFAWNAWGILGGGYGRQNDDLGIGNNTVITPDGRINPDWTYRGNSDNYTIKNLEVWVQPSTAEQLSFSSPTYTVNEDGTLINNITIIRSNGDQGEVSVTVTPSNGTATSVLDYNNAPITVTFADGETSKKIAIPIVKDTAYEGNENLNLTLSNPTNGAILGTQKTATLTIVDTPITYYLTTPTTWTDAQVQAQAMGGNLVTINDAAENQFLVNSFGSNESFWIGFTDAVQEGNWQWINGEPITYTNWASDEPSNTFNEDYAIINHHQRVSGQWYDLANSPPSYSNLPTQLKGIIEVLNGTSTISIADTTINESQNQATVTVKLTGISHQAFSVDYNTNDGTAKAGEDYTSVSGTLTFNGGESVKTITIPINNDSNYEGNETFTLNLSNPTGGAVLGTNQATVTIIDDDVPQPGTLAFSNSQFSVNEDGTPIAAVKITRSNGTDGQVSTTIDLENGTATPDDYDKTSILVTFANGETEKLVTIPITNDTFVENTETINLTLTNPSNGAILGTQKTAVLSILDDDVQLNFNAANYTVREDGTAVTDIIITRTGRTTGIVGATLNFANGTATGCACGLHLTTSDFLSSPISVILGDNEISKVIPVQLVGTEGSNFIPIINDTKVESNETFTISLTNPTGGATIGNQNNATVTILDDDVQLAFSSPNFSVREDGTTISSVTVNRLGRLTGIVGATITLTGETATYPDDYTQTSLDITFAEGETSKIVNIPVRNDIIYELDETVQLTLTNATGGATIGSQNTAILTIVDNGLTPHLTLNIDKDTVAENAGNNAATGTITRSIVTDEDLIITLNSNDTSEITVPNQVIIPANQSSVTFSLNAVDDNILDGIQTVTITATANEFSQGIDTINVADINVPDLKVVNLSASTLLFTGKQGNFTYRVVNQGLSNASGTWTDKIYLSTDTTLETNKDIILDSYQFTGDMANGLYYERNIPFFIPKTPGQYYLIAQTDTANTVNEGTGIGEENNTTITPITITPAYHATVSTDTEVGVTGNKVILQGKAYSNQDNSPVPYEFVTIAIKNNGTVRELTAFTDKNGNFVQEFQPLPGEGGEYQINAYFPSYSSEDTTPEDSFKLLGMRFNTAGVYYQVNADAPFNAQVNLQNLTNIPITGINYTVNGAPQDWNIQVNVPDTLAGSDTNTISYTITAPNNSAITQDIFNLNLTSAEGVTTTLPITVKLRRIVPQLVADTTLLNKGMLRGEQTPVEFTVTNNGGIATGDIQVILPNAPWLKLASPVTLSSLNPGESSKVTLLLTPDANLPLTVYNGNLVLDVVGNDGDLSLPFSFRAVSDAVGSLKISVVDELTFFTESAPKLKDATVILRDYVTGNEVRRITTDTTGMVSWDNLTEGYYQLEIKAKNHDSYSQIVQIKAGETEDIESFLSRQTVKYVWRVVPTEIEDKYSITIESVFETDVPIPTVTIDPPLIDLANLQVIGQVMQVDMTITNHGLIAANDVRLNVANNSFYKIEPLIEDIGILNANSSITVPVKITRIGDLDTPENNTDGLRILTAQQSEERCIVEICVFWDYDCGADKGKPRKVEKATYVTLVNMEGPCPESGYNYIIPPPVMPNSEFLKDFVEGVKLIPIIVGQPSNSENCNPHLYEISEKFFNCYKDLVLSLIPFSWVFGGQLVSCASSIVGFLEGMKDGFGKTDALNLIGFINDCLVKGSSAISIAATIIKCGIEIGEATKGFQFDENSTQAQSSSFSLTTELNLNSLQTIQYLSNSSLQNQILLFNQHLERLQKIVSAIIFPVNESVWFQDTDPLNSSTYLSFFFSKIEESTENGLKISDSEKDEILNLPLPIGVTGTDVNKFIERWNRTIDYWNAGIFNLSDVPQGENTDFIAIDIWKTNINAAIEAIEQSQAEGFTNIVDEIEYGYENFKNYLEGKNGGVCAQVKLQINQDAIMTRSAFLGTLEIDNGNDTTNLENITVTINIKDSQGNTVNDLFGITNPTLSNLTAVDGTGTLLANSLGSAEWTFIPTGNAAPDEPTVYSIGGSLSYNENGNTVTVPLFSTPVTVFPQAALYLDYFHQRDVFADDPFTLEIEPSVPFSLGILVKNQGKGTAKNLRITSAQPKIIDNEKGLLIDFNIIGTQIGNKSITPSLSVNFGNIEAGQTAIADWLFKSSLQGKFTDYQATFEHINDLGKPELSLIKEVKIHELTHKVNVDSDNLPDFLVNDTFDANFYPDILYFSDGTTAPVNVVTNATATLNNQQAQITVNVNSGWTYLHLADPSNGTLEIAQVLRSDGTAINLTNVWTTDRTFPATGRPIYENILHLLDYNTNPGEATYTVIYTSGGATVTDIIDVNPDPRSSAVNAIIIEFSEPIKAHTFDYNDLILTLNNGTNLITPNISIIPLSTIRYQITGLETLTNTDGNYQLTVNATQIEDLDGKLGTGSLSETWIKTTAGNADNTPPTITNIQHLQLDPRNIPVSSLDVNLSEPIDLSTFTWEDITLTRNGSSNLINNTVTINAINDTNYRINGLSNLTQTEGNYILTVNGNGIKDLSGNLGTGSNSETWIMDTTPPDAPTNLVIGNKSINLTTINLINTTQINLSGSLSETGLTVYVYNKSLNQPLAQAIVNNHQFNANLQLTAAGSQELELQVIDAAGNSHRTAIALFVDLIQPRIIQVLDLPNIPTIDPINYIDVRFSEPINLISFDSKDITLTRNSSENLNLENITIEQLTDNIYRINGLRELTTTAGNYQLNINSNTIEDRAGNRGENSFQADFTIISNKAEIIGQVWHDINGDGIKNSEEIGLSNWIVYLDINNNGQLNDDEIFLKTDENGNYHFTNLSPNTYTIAQIIPEGWQQTNSVPPTTLEAGDIATDINISNHKPAQIKIIDNSGAIDDQTIKFTTPLSKYRTGVNDSDLVRAAFPDSFKSFEIHNSGDQLLRISKCTINAPGVSTDLDFSQGDILLNGGEKLSVNLTYKPTQAGEKFDLVNGLVIESNALNNLEKIHLQGQSTFNSDITYDGIVNFQELAQLNVTWGHSSNSSGWDLTKDPNGDGMINFQDLALLNTEWNQSIF